MADSTKWSKGYAVDFLKLLIVWHGNVLASRPCKMMKTVTVTYSENFVHWIYKNTKENSSDKSSGSIYLVGGVNDFFNFHPYLGNMIPFDGHIFHMGWFNHQLDILFQ